MIHKVGGSGVSNSFILIISSLKQSISHAVTALYNSVMANKDEGAQKRPAKADLI